MALGGVGVEEVIAPPHRRRELPTEVRGIDESEVQALAAEG
jgi:hypothetical protein